MSQIHLDKFLLFLCTLHNITKVETYMYNMCWNSQAKLFWWPQQITIVSQPLAYQTDSLFRAEPQHSSLEAPLIF